MADAGGFRLVVDDETGKKFWRGAGTGDKDVTAFDPGDPLVLTPEAWPVGTVVSARVPVDEDGYSRV